MSNQFRKITLSIILDIAWRSTTCSSLRSYDARSHAIRFFNFFLSSFFKFLAIIFTLTTTLTTSLLPDITIEKDEQPTSYSARKATGMTMRTNVRRAKTANVLSTARKRASIGAFSVCACSLK